MSFGPGPYVAGFPLAEWFVWNWWRIRWEFSRPSDTREKRGWDFAHQLNTVGDGYAWPCISISSDGINAVLTSRQTSNPQNVLFRYLGLSGRAPVPVLSLERAIDAFGGGHAVEIGQQWHSLHQPASAKGPIWQWSGRVTRFLATGN